MRIKKLDKYIFKKFISTFLVASFMISILAIIIDFSEKYQDFVQKGAPLNAIIYDYYLNFIPYLFALIGPFFVFIATVYFTSKMTAKSETVAIFAGGVTFGRFLRTYFVIAVGIAIIFYFGNHWLIPTTNKQKLDFEREYVHFKPIAVNQIEFSYINLPKKDASVTINKFVRKNQEALNVSIRVIEDDKLIFLMRANKMQWKEESEKWKVFHAQIWEIDGEQERVYTRTDFDTAFGFSPEGFFTRVEYKDGMNKAELAEFIRTKELEGFKDLPAYKIEMHTRTSNAFSTIIFTLLAVAFSTRKRRGGMSINIAMGITLSFLYASFIRFSSTLGTNADFPVLLAVWLPNIIFGIGTSILLYRATR